MPRQLPDARIWSFGWGGRGSLKSTVSLPLIANNLSIALSDISERHERDLQDPWSDLRQVYHLVINDQGLSLTRLQGFARVPLIFVTSGFGGTIVKKVSVIGLLRQDTVMNYLPVIA